MSEELPVKLKRIRSRGPLGEKVYAILKEAITSGRFPPGSWLPEDRLTKALGASRTPVREAINRLQGDGLVEILPRKGARIPEFSHEALEELFEAREIIETAFLVRAGRAISESELLEIKAGLEKAEQAMEEAAEEDEWKHRRQEYLRLDRAFHDRLIEATGNRHWIGIYQGLRDRIEIHAHHISETYPRNFKWAVEEHYNIIDALLAKDYTAAKLYMRQHIQNFRLRRSID